MNDFAKQLFDSEVARMRKDAATQRMLASFAKQRQQHWEENMRKANNVRTLAEVADEMNANFEAGEASAVNGGRI